MTTTSQHREKTRTRVILIGASLLIVLAVLAAIAVQNRPSGAPGADGSTDPSVDAASQGDATSQDDASSQDVDGVQPGADPEETESVEPLDVSTPLSGPVGAEGDEVERVTGTVALVVDATNEIGLRGDGAIEGLDAVATDFVLGELENLSREYQEQGLTQTGEARVVSTELIDVDLDADPPTMTVGVCVDVSELRITDSTGTDQSDRLYNPGRPVRHIYGAVHVDGVWKLSSHEIPDEQECPVSEESS